MRLFSFLASLSLLSIFCLSTTGSAEELLSASEEPIELDPIAVHAPPLASHAEIKRTSTTLSWVDAIAHQTASTRSVSLSGAASLSSVTPADAINAGAAKIIIDGIELPDPLGTGFDFNVFPALAFESIEMNPNAEIHLRSQASHTTHRPEHRHSQVLIQYGSGNTRSIEASTPLTQNNILLGVQYLKTDGTLPYVTPPSTDPSIQLETGKRGTRTQNDAEILGGFLQTTQEWGNIKSTTHLLARKNERTNPGSLYWPQRNHEHDLFFWGAEKIQWRDSSFKASSHWLNNKTEAIETTSQSTLLEFDRNFFSTQVRFDRLQQGTALLSEPRVNATLKANLESFEIQPKMKWAKNLGTFAEIETQVKTGPFEFNVSYLRPLPDLLSRMGYKSADFELVANPDLTPPQDFRCAITYLQSQHKSTRAATSVLNSLKASAFVLNSLNRPTYEAISYTQGKMINLSHALLLGGQIDTKIEVLTDLHPWVSASFFLEKSEDFSTHKDLPYKPRLRALLQSGFSPLPALRFFLGAEMRSKQTTALGRSLEDMRSLPAQTIFNAEAEWQIHSSFMAALKIENLTEKAGWITEGFPLAARTATLSVQWNGF